MPDPISPFDACQNFFTPPVTQTGKAPPSKQVDAVDIAKAAECLNKIAPQLKWNNNTLKGLITARAGIYHGIDAIERITKQTKQPDEKTYLDFYPKALKDLRSAVETIFVAAVNRGVSDALTPLATRFAIPHGYSSIEERKSVVDDNEWEAWITFSLRDLGLWLEFDKSYFAQSYRDLIQPIPEAQRPAAKLLIVVCEAGDDTNKKLCNITDLLNRLFKNR